MRLWYTTSAEYTANKNQEAEHCSIIAGRQRAPEQIPRDASRQEDRPPLPPGS